MRILIDGFFIRKKRGLGRYVRELLYALSNYKNKNFEIFVLIYRQNKEDIIFSLENINFINIRYFPFPIWEQFIVPFYARKLGADIIHFPYNTATLFRSKKYKIVVTVHDMNFFDINGGSLYQRLGNLYRRIIVSRFTNDYKIVTVSKSSCKSIINHIGIHPRTIYTPVEFFERSCNLYCNDEILTEYKLDKNNYILHIGGISPHKNTEIVIKSFLKSKKDLDKETKLVILGMSKNNIFRKKYNDTSIIFPGWIDDKYICSLYKNSRFVLFPSLKEGYGLPILESFVFNKPVITSNLPPMNEIGEKGTILVNPYSVADIEIAIKRLFFNKRLYDALQNEINEWKSNFSAKKFAEEIYSFYEEVINE